MVTRAGGLDHTEKPLITIEMVREARSLNVAVGYWLLAIGPLDSSTARLLDFSTGRLAVWPSHPVDEYRAVFYILGMMAVLAHVTPRANL